MTQDILSQMPKAIARSTSDECPKCPSTETRLFRKVKNEKSVQHKMHLSQLGQSQLYKPQERCPLIVHIHRVAKKYYQK